MSSNWRDWYDEENDTRWVFGTITICLFMFWVIIEFLEKKCGMEPKIFTSEKVNELAKMVKNEFEELSAKREESRTDRENSRNAYHSDNSDNSEIDMSVSESVSTKRSTNEQAGAPYGLHEAKSLSLSDINGDSSNGNDRMKHRASNEPRLLQKITPFDIGTADDVTTLNINNSDHSQTRNDRKNNNNNNNKDVAAAMTIIDIGNIEKKNEKNDGKDNMDGNDEKKTSFPRPLKKEKSKLSQFKDNIATSIHFGQSSSSMLHRLTKTMDKKGRYRVTVRSSVSVMRVITNITLNGILIWSFIQLPGWWYDHVWLQNHDTIHCTPLRVAYLILASFYLWDLNVNRYGRLSWSTIFHHSTVLIAVFRIFVFDAFIPSATVFGAFGVSFGYIMHFALLLRYLSPKSKWLIDHADIVRKSFLISFYAFIIHNFILNTGLQLVVFVRGIQTGRLTILQLIWMVVSICIWMNEDQKVLKVLKEYSRHHYEIAELLQIKDTYASVRKTKQEEKQDKKMKKLFGFYKKRKKKASKK